jgi:sulfate adenylyltransferase (ADP) / ATP adenylyltransferase
MSDSFPLLSPDRFWQQVIAQTRYAVQCGALQSIATEYEFVEDGGTQFLVRVLANLSRKDTAQTEQAAKRAATGAAFNPFLPYEKDLFVADLSATHLCLLNKFNVVDHHLLIVTRAFESQETWLTLADFEALWVCMMAVDGFAFYNGGKDAGASQPHKHLQLVPLPFVPGGLSIPIEPAIATAQTHGKACVDLWPYRHAIATLPLTPETPPAIAAPVLLETYQRLLTAVGLVYDPVHPIQSGAYNLLVTRQWMLLVPRSQESFKSIAVNSLGFAGALLVRNAEQMALLKHHGPLHILRGVGQAR